MQAWHYHVFSLPSNILSTLISRDRLVPKPSRSPSPTQKVAAPSGSSTRTCNVCLAAVFDDVEEQRAHFRSDWHRYNVKVRFNGGSPVTEPAFADLIDGLEDSISGSASSEDDDSDISDTVATLVNKVKIPLRAPSPSSESVTLPRTALAWFHSPPATQIGVYRALFSNPTDPSSHLSELKALQKSAERKWALFMTAGGHFAGAVVRVSRGESGQEEVEKRKPKRPKPDTEVLMHKTFHRYTTRRKQGGSQSINDNAKGNAKSAGAQLRRYGEQALRDDIRSLLQEWADDIADCERIWIRASSSNKKIFYDSESAIIVKGDDRLRTFPFPTRRPTQSELTRCLLELTKVKVSHLTEDALRALDEAYLASLPKPKPKPTVPASTLDTVKPQLPKLSKEEEAFREKWARLLEMVSKGRLDPLVPFWTREGSNIGGIDSPIPEWTGEYRATLLQVATVAGHENVVRWLLEDAHADPTIDVPFRNTGENGDDDPGHMSDTSDSPLTLTAGSRRTAYDLARTRGVRNVFRRCAAAHPDWWDWLGAARVPSILSHKMEEEQEEKKKVRKKALKEKVKDREAREKEKEKEKAPLLDQVVETVKMQCKDEETSGPRKLGGSAGGTEGLSGLTPEMRARIERERRARAAEARIKAGR